MRIVHIITRMILGGAQENTLYTVDGLHHDFDDDVTLITGPAMGPEGSLLQRAAERNLKVEIIDELRREVHIGRDYKSYRVLVQMLRDIKPDVVHTHSSKAGILGRFAARAAKVPVIVHTVHGSPFHAYESWLNNSIYKFAERRAARYTDSIVSVCNAMTDQFVEAGIARPDRFKTIYSGMDVTPFLNPPSDLAKLRSELDLELDHLVIGTIARLFELKGHDDVIAAAERLIPQFPAARFVFVGDGLRHDELKKSIAEKELTEHFRFTGLVPPSRIPELIHAMDIVVHCSLREGLARVLPQGLLAAKPVVSYDIDGAREVVLNDETGFLVPAQDIDSLATALERLCGDEALRHQLGAEGRRRCREQFRHEFMTSEIRDLYVRLLEKSSRRN